MAASSPPSSPEIEYDETPLFSPPRLSRTSTAPTTPGSVATPFSLKSRPTTLSLLSAVDFRLSNASSSLAKFPVTVSYQDVQWELQLLADEREYISSHVEPFNKRLLRKHLNAGKSPISSPLILASYFLQYLSRPGLPLEALRITLRAFERHFLSDTNIHSCARQLAEDSDQVTLLRTYYAALGKIDEPASSVSSALIESANDGDAQIYAVFGGQGVGNPLCLKDLSYVYSIYGSLLDDLLDVAARTLDRLASSPKVSSFFENIDFDINRWLIDPSTMPSPPQVALAPLSFPIIGLLSLSHYCIACKTLGKNPGQLRSSFRGVTGHSQGIVVAAAISRSGSWKEFYESVVFVMEILFWIGFESHNAAIGTSLSAEDAKDSVRSGEGQPSSMLGIRGLDKSGLQELIDEINGQVSKKDHIHMALINSRDNMVVSGPQRSLRGLNLRLRKFRVDENQRNLIIQNRFLPISAPFHSPHLESAAKRVLSALGPSPFTGSNLKVGLYNTHTGEDLRRMDSVDLQKSLVHMVMTEMVDWPKASYFTKATHIMDFGPGRIGLLQSQLTEGTGVRIILASDIRAVQEDVGSKEELFASSLPPLAANWGQSFAPKLEKGPNGEPGFQTRMTRLMEVPPVMVAPVTTTWDFIAAVKKAGYHAELAGGDCQIGDFEEAIRKVSPSATSKHGITCNLLNDNSLQAKISTIKQLIQEGLPIDGLTFGGDFLPSEILKQFVEDLGLKQISFRPTSSQHIINIIKIAKEYPNFCFGLQWAHGAHDTFSDPIFKTYGLIRKCSNILLIANNEFGGAEDTYPYLTGEWAETFGYPRMPFDGVLLGNRMMTAKESHTSAPAKDLIVQTEGTADHQSHKVFNDITSGIITIQSRYGEPMHALATRGALLWKHLDTTIFSIKDSSKRAAELRKNRSEIIKGLNRDYQKPWFAVDLMGDNVEVGDMTYLEVLHRLVSLMYIRRQNRWIDQSYERFILDFVARARESLVEISSFSSTEHIEEPFQFLAHFQDCYPIAEEERLHSGDVSYFMALCSRGGQKAVNFIPSIDQNFEIWFKGDFMWQAEDIDAVMNRDVQRVIVIQGPVAARESRVIDESCKDILDGIVKSHTEMLRRDLRYSASGASGIETPSHLENISIADYPGQRVYKISHFWDANPEILIRCLPGTRPSWLQTCLWDNSIIQSGRRVKNPIRAAFFPHPGNIIDIRYGSTGENRTMTLYSLRKGSNDMRTLISLNCHDGRHVIVKLFHSNPRGGDPRGGENLKLEFTFQYSKNGSPCKLTENMDGRQNRLKDFYSIIWLGQSPSDLEDCKVNSIFSGGRFIMSEEIVQKFADVVGGGEISHQGRQAIDDSVPIDMCALIAWNAIMKPLLIPDMEGDLSRVIRRSIDFDYYPGVEPIAVGDVLYSTSFIEAITIEETSKAIQISTQIRRHETPVVKVTVIFLLRGSFSDFENTFRYTEEPDVEVAIKSPEIRHLLFSREWLDTSRVKTDIINTTVVFRLRSFTTFDASSSFTTLQVTGQAYIRSNLGLMSKFARVSFKSGPIASNPVMEFLQNIGKLSKQWIPLTKPIHLGPKIWKIQIPASNKPYAVAARDLNPIHTSRIFARYVSLPGCVTHGTYFSAAARQVVESAVCGGDYRRFRRWKAGFEGIVRVNDVLRVEMIELAVFEGRLVVNVKAFNDEDGRLVLDAEGEIEIPFSGVII